MSTAQHIMKMLQTEMSSVVGLSIVRLVLAAILGGIIGFEREVKHRPAGLRTNMFICFGAALFTILSDQLAAEHTGDHTRIAAQIIPGIGFIGAGSILHARGRFVTGLTTAATLFVVASIGMAVGGGLYLTATFATGVIVIALFLLGQAEQVLNLKLLISTYEVTGGNADEMTAEVNRKSFGRITTRAAAVPSAPNISAKRMRSRQEPVAPRPRAASAETNLFSCAGVATASRLTPCISSRSLRSWAGSPTISALLPATLNSRVNRSRSQAPNVSKPRTPPMSIDMLRTFGASRKTVDNGEIERATARVMINARKKRFRSEYDLLESISSSRRSAFDRQRRPAIV